MNTDSNEQPAPERVFLKACHPDSPNRHCSWDVSKTPENSVKYIRADLTRSRAGAAPADKWLPIESAPKDGTEVLLVWKWNSGVHEGTDVVLERWYCRTHAHLSRAKNCPNEPDCKMGWGAYAGEMTHWKPKPALPGTATTSSPATSADSGECQGCAAAHAGYNTFHNLHTCKEPGRVSDTLSSIAKYLDQDGSNFTTED